MTLSIMVEHRDSRKTAVTASIIANIDMLADGVHNEIKEFTPPKSKLTKEDIKAFILALSKRYEQQGGTLVTLEETLQRERGDDLQASQMLDAKTTAGYQLILDLKDVIRSSYGADFLNHLQLQGRTKQSPPAILQTLRHTEGWLKDHNKVFPQKTRSFSQSLNKETLLKTIEPVTQALEQAIQANATDRRETESALSNKNKALTSFDDTDQQTIAIMLALMEMAGLENEAERLRPTISQTRRNQGSPAPTDDNTTNDNTTNNNTSNTTEPS